jgi:hypothetical protein
MGAAISTPVFYLLGCAILQRIAEQRKRLVPEIMTRLDLIGYDLISLFGHDLFGKLSRHFALRGPWGPDHALAAHQ